MPNVLAQFVRNRVLRSPPGSAHSLRTRIWRRVERGILRIADPSVRYRIHTFDLEMPLSHRLPWFQKDLPEYGWNLARVARIVSEKYKDMCAIDIGANVGDSVAIMRSAASFPILCVEADERYFRYLSANIRQFPDVTTARAYLGERANELTGRIESDHGTARLVADAAEKVRILPLDELLQQHPQFAGAKLLKIDTDGYDCKIIRGAGGLLKRAHPIVFFEYDPHFLAEQGDDGLSIFPMLDACGYAQMLVYDNLGSLVGRLNVADGGAIRAMHDRYAGADGRYADLCAFAGEDAELLDRIIALEPGNPNTDRSIN